MTQVMGMARKKHGQRRDCGSAVYVAAGMLIGILVVACARRILLSCGLEQSECCLGGRTASWLPISANYRRKMMRNPAFNKGGKHITHFDDSPATFDYSKHSTNGNGFILIGVMTAQKYLDSRAVAAYKTWSKSIPGKVLFFSSEGSKSKHGLPLVALPGVDDVYPPQRKSFMMLKYMHDHFIDSFEWFARVDDDVYIRGDKLEQFLRSINSSDAQFIGQAGMGTKEEFGHLSFDVDENFCMGGPGIVFSRRTLVRVGTHTSYCLRNTHTSHEDVEVGRCVQKVAGIPCTWAFEMQRLFYQNYGEEKGSFKHHLIPRHVNRAITLHPVKDPKYLHKIHIHFQKLRVRQLNQRQLMLHREIATSTALIQWTSDDVKDNLTTETSNPKEGLKPSVTKFVPASPEEVLTWDFFKKALMSHKNENPAKVDPATRLALNDIVMEVMDMINVNSKKLGRTIDFKEVLYGYRRINPLFGADYVLDLLLLYRKLRGKRMAVPVRRHAYLQQTFNGIEFREENPIPDSISSSETKKPSSFFETVYKKLGFASRRSAQKLPAEMVHFILPLAGRLETFERFMRNYDDVCLKTGENTSLRVILYNSADGTPNQKTISLVQEYRKKYPGQRLEVILASGEFSRGAGLDLGTQASPEDALLCFIDVDIYFTTSVLQRIRTNTKKGELAYFPVVFSQYYAETMPGCSNWSDDLEFCGWSNINKRSEDYGYWRDFGFGIASIYKSDYISVGGFNQTIHGWGKEDVDLFEKILFSNVTVFRSVDPGITHVYHPVVCNSDLESSQYQMCEGSKVSSYGSVNRLQEMLLKSDLLSQAINISLENDPS